MQLLSILFLLSFGSVVLAEQINCTISTTAKEKEPTEVIILGPTNTSQPVVIKYETLRKKFSLVLTKADPTITDSFMFLNDNKEMISLVRVTASTESESTESLIQVTINQAWSNTDYFTLVDSFSVNESLVQFSDTDEYFQVSCERDPKAPN